MEKLKWVVFLPYFVDGIVNGVRSAKTRTSVGVDRALWLIVKIKADRERLVLMDALEQILREYIKNHGKEYGYTLEQTEKK